MVNHRLCPRCKQVKAAAEFGPNKAQKDGLQTYCRTCYTEYNEGRKAKLKADAHRRYLRDREKQRKRSKDAYQRDPEAFRARSRKANMTPEQYANSKRIMKKYLLKVKRDVFNHYGTVCACCGESNPGFLTIDHIDGCGKEIRKEHGMGNRFYRWLRMSGFPVGFQTLCYNCNMGRARCKGVCPHHLPPEACAFFPDDLIIDGDPSDNRGQGLLSFSE